MLAVSAVVAASMPLASARPAGATTAPDLTCGFTQAGPCTETAHFDEINEMNPPGPGSEECPAFVATDFATFVGTGNGIEHITFNKAQDAWFTTTFTGTMTVTFYLHGTVDSDGNVTSVSDPDPNVLPFTGKLTEWFGISLNKQTEIDHSTFHFDGTNANGESISVHDASHSSWSPGTDPSGPPTKMFDKFRCS
jgi:hypothetical protein